MKVSHLHSNHRASRRTHKLRHYTATELIAAGVDVRTVAGRLGHGGGGTTTLRTYSAWVSEADQRAAVGLGAGMPVRPVEEDETVRQQTAPRHPYEKVAAEIRRQVLSGEIAAGAELRPERELVAEFEVSVSTVRRATVLLRKWGILGDTGRRIIRHFAVGAHAATQPEPRAASDSQYWSVTVRSVSGESFSPRLVHARLDDPDAFRPHLIGIAQLEASLPEPVSDWIGRYELEVRSPDQQPTAVSLFKLRWSE